MLMCAARCDHLQSFVQGEKIHIFSDTLCGGITFQGKSNAEEISTLISVAFPKADCEVQVPLLPETVFQPHSLCF